MPQLVAITDAAFPLPWKRYALLFDRIGVLELEDALSHAPREVARQLDYLQSSGILFDAQFTHDETDMRLATHLAPLAHHIEVHQLVSDALIEIARYPQRISELMTETNLRHESERREPPPYLDIQAAVFDAHAALRELLTVSRTPSELVALAVQTRESSRAYFPRFVASILRETQSIPATALLPEGFSDAPSVRSARDSVVDVLLRALPMPDDTTPWNEIIQFRQDHDSRRALRRLQHWMSSFATSDRNAAEIEDELQTLVDKYLEYMRIHKLRVRPTAVRIFVAAASVVENVVKLKFSDAVNALFSVREQQIPLLEAELNAPGRDVAYVVKANEVFDRGARRFKGELQR